MAQNDEQRDRGVVNASGDKDGPRNDAQIEAQESDRNDVAGMRDYQEGPDAERSGRADADRSGTARRAEQSTGQDYGDEARGDAERAFDRSRGDRSERSEPDDPMDRSRMG